MQKGTKIIQVLCSEGKTRKELPLTAKVVPAAHRYYCALSMEPRCPMRTSSSACIPHLGRPHPAAADLYLPPSTLAAALP